MTPPCGRVVSVPVAARQWGARIRHPGRSPDSGWVDPCLVADSVFRPCLCRLRRQKQFENSPDRSPRGHTLPHSRWMECRSRDETLAYREQRSGHVLPARARAREDSKAVRSSRRNAAATCRSEKSCTKEREGRRRSRRAQLYAPKPDLPRRSCKSCRRETWPFEVVFPRCGSGAEYFQRNVPVFLWQPEPHGGRDAK
jgi:hypothetical protein